MDYRSKSMTFSKTQTLFNFISRKKYVKCYFLAVLLVDYVGKHFSVCISLCLAITRHRQQRQRLCEQYPVNALFVLNCRMLSHVWGFAKQPWNTVVGSALALTVKPLTWKRLMSRGLPAFFRQFWLHFRKNFRKNLCMGQRETNESMPAPGSTIWATLTYKSNKK